MSDANNHTKCQGVDPGSGCLDIFQFKTERGLCAKCDLVDVQFKDQPEKQKEYQNMPQCTGCGSCSKNLKGVYCGACKQKNDTVAMPPPLPKSTQVITTSSAPILHTSPSSSILQSPLDHALAIVNSANITTHSGATPTSNFGYVMHGMKKIQQEREQQYAKIKEAKTGIGRRVNLHLTFHGDNNVKPIHAIGRLADTHSDQLTLKEAVMLHVEKVNKNIWEDATSGRLTGDDFYIRFPGNNVLMGCTEYDTLGRVHDVTLSLPTRQISWFKPPTDSGKTARTTNGNIVVLIVSVILKISKVEERDGRLPVELGGTPVSGKSKGRGKRSAGDDLASMTSTVRRRIDAPLQSTFRPRALVSATVSGGQDGVTHDDFESVKLLLAHVNVLESGWVDIKWEAGDTKKAEIVTVPCAHGTSKLVYKLKIGGERFVAKRYANIPSGGFALRSKPVTIAAQARPLHMVTNAEYLVKETEVQYSMKYFLEEFYANARTTGESFSDDFIVTDCLLAREVVIDSTPSRASGLTKEDFAIQDSVFDNDPPDSEDIGNDGSETAGHPLPERLGPTWLIEHERPTQVTKYSGTLQQSSRQTLPFMTMSAFAHFSLIWSNGERVFADLQSSPGVLDSMPVRILFDGMAHTEKGNAGPGDHGEQGIKQFSMMHICNKICDSLRINETEDSEDEEDEGTKGQKNHII
ncbi:hypothetical protein E1B28_008147 [Marasmius oreades]|uniref:Alpha-type protein kinase domain-containing protein n=1 Tax=Marasmius oreades TaxID=181124 RepID=A0A9P7RYZ6_9AGAR|nr:uncharacterized protein E1B28_008147 [Marasmius oreades]KAG7091746.1 hypothetical protein E1B28_008147 [Marasmius oreades]